MKMMNDMELNKVTGGSITMGNVGQNNSENQIDPVETFLSWLLGKKFTDGALYEGYSIVKYILSK